MGTIDLNFTGEFFVPGKSGERIEADHMERYKFASQFVKGKRVLDIACGSGYAAPFFEEAGAVSYQGVDINQTAVDYSNQTYGSETISYSVGDIASFNNGLKYDVITCFETIEHIENYEKAIENLYRLLDKGGLLLISSPFRPVASPNATGLHDKPSNKFHTQEFIPEELSHLLKIYGFSVNEDSVYGQRQRKSNKLIRKISSKIFGNPNKKSSPVVSKIPAGMIPIYFLVLATKD